MAFRFLRPIETWRVPPNWSPRDWFEEMRAESIAAAWEAERDFDPTRGVPLPAFVHQRVLARVLALYRREWSYARRCGPLPQGDDRDDAIADGLSSLEASESLRAYLPRLSDHQRRLIKSLYWDEKSQV